MRTGIFSPHAHPAWTAVERPAQTLPAARPRL